MNVTPKPKSRKRSGPFANCSLQGGGLVLDGQAVKVRLQTLAGVDGPVHVDWLRFSVPRANVIRECHYLESSEDLFCYQVPVWDEITRMARLRKQIEHVTLDTSALAAARILARQLVDILGSEFECDYQPALGRDFFSFRLSIRRCGAEVGWVGAGATSDSPNQARQNSVVHVNLYGEACLFISRKAWDAVSALGQSLGGWLTRCDLAVDFWQGIPGGVSGLEAAYLAGDMDVRGKRPKVAHAGDWINKRACTFYLGTRDSGKYSRIYCKGDQLFGLDANDPWIRLELQWGDQLRVLPWEMVSKPAGFFAAASDWHASMLALATDQVVVRESVTCTPAPAAMVCEAEAYRNLTWTFSAAASSVATAFKYLGESQFLALVDRATRPGRLNRFTESEVVAGYAAAARRFFGQQDMPGLHSDFQQGVGEFVCA